MPMKRYLLSALAALALSTAVRAAEVEDLSTTDASNTNSSYGFPENMAPSAVNDNARAFQGMIARWYNDWRGNLVAGGITGALTLTPNRTISALTDGHLFGFEMPVGVTGATTLNVSALGAKTIKKAHDQDLTTGDLEAGQKIVVVYDGTADTFQLLSVTAADTLTDPMTTRGDIIVRDSSNATARLAVGAADTVLASDGTDVAWSVSASALGKQTIWMPAGAMSSPTTNGAASFATQGPTAGRPVVKYLAFDSSADEHAQFDVTFPKGWDEGTVTFVPYWSQESTDSGDVTWFLQGVALGDNDSYDVAFGTAVTNGDTAHATAYDLMIGPESDAVTIAGTPAEGELTVFRIGRDVSDNDTFAADAWLTGIKILYTLDAASDD